MKEAVVFILDASSSMKKTTYPDHGGSPPSSRSRLFCAQQAIESMLCDLMIKSKTHEAGLVVLKTRETKHHLVVGDVDEDDDLPFPNITEVSEVGRPTLDLIRRLWEVEAQEESNLRGDFCDGIVVAADALFVRTNKKRYQRRIVLLTDAEHEVVLDMNQILVVVDSLRAMDCRLEVIGLDFLTSAEFDQPAPAETAKIKQEDDKRKHAVPEDLSTTIMNHDEQQHNVMEDHDDDSEHYNSNADNSCSDDDDDGIVVYSDRMDREKLLISLTEKTGGSVIAASTMQEILDATLGKRIPKSVRRKVQFRIAPGLALENVRYSLLFKRSTAPRLKREAVLVDHHTGNPMVNGLGNEMTSAVAAITTHWDAENDDIEVEAQDRTRAVRYGSDLIPMSVLDMRGLQQMGVSSTLHDDPYMQILGYLDQSEIPRSILMGPTYAISGDSSQRSCTMIAALAQTLSQLHQVAIATLVKSKGGDPILIGIFPFHEPTSSTNQTNTFPEHHPPIRLCFLQLPFAGEVRRFLMSSFAEHFAVQDESGQQELEHQTSDDLIDALMLPETALHSQKIANPFLRSFHKTVLHRALKPATSDLVTVRPGDNKDGDDPMSTPSTVLQNAQSALEAFRSVFPLEKIEQRKVGSSRDKSGTATRKSVLTFRDYIS